MQDPKKAEKRKKIENRIEKVYFVGLFQLSEFGFLCQESLVMFWRWKGGISEPYGLLPSHKHHNLCAAEHRVVKGIQGHSETN